MYFFELSEDVRAGMEPRRRRSERSGQRVTLTAREGAAEDGDGRNTGKLKHPRALLACAFLPRQNTPQNAKDALYLLHV